MKKGALSLNSDKKWRLYQWQINYDKQMSKRTLIKYSEEVFIYKPLAEVPVVALRIFLNRILKKKSIFEKKEIPFFSLCYPRGTKGFPQKRSAHSVQL